MPIPDIDKLRVELELTGEKEVRAKLAANVYSSWKVETVKNWLREKEATRATVAAKEMERHAKYKFIWTKVGICAAVLGVVVAFMGKESSLLPCCSKSPIEVVKSGTVQFDPSVTVGEALSGYQFFNDSKWRFFRDSKKSTNC